MEDIMDDHAARASGRAAFDDLRLGQLLLQASGTSQRSIKHQMLESFQVTSAKGGLQVDRNSRLGAGEARPLIAELKEKLASEQPEHDDTARRDILELWILVEPFLLAGELTNLRPAFLKVLSLPSDEPFDLSRNGR